MTTTTDAGIKIDVPSENNPVLALSLTIQELDDILAWAEEHGTNVFDLCRTTLLEAVAA